MIDLSILVVAYNTKALLKKCIESIINYKGKYKIEVIVVDNDSDDGTFIELNENYTQIKKIFNKYNYGFAIGMNQAYNLADGKYVMTFNPDAEIYDESIDAAIEHLEKNNDTGLLGMMTEDSNGLVEIPFNSFYLNERFEFFRFFNKKNNFTQHTEIIEVQWIWGTAIFAKKENLGKSFFVEDNFLFWEEYWLCKKVKESGFKIRILKNHKLLHHISASFKTDKNKLELIRILSTVNGHIPKIKEFGILRTYISYLLKIIDHALMLCVLLILTLVKQHNQNERNISLINNKANLKAYLNLLLRGLKYRNEFQHIAILKLNNGVFPIYPPVTLSKNEKKENIIG